MIKTSIIQANKWLHISINIKENKDKIIIIFFIYTYRFSFVISSRGVVNHVFHPGGEDDEVVAIKKGLASIFAAKLHEEGEVKTLKKKGTTPKLK